MSDLIDRQAAIDAIDKRFDDVPMELTTEILQLRHDLRERIPSAQPATNCSEIPNSSDDTISRQAAIEALARMMPRSYTPDGSHPADEEIFRAQEVFADCIEALEILPTAHPETATITIGRTKGGVVMWYECDACGESINQNDCYCRNCGRKLTLPEPYQGGDE